jgi:uncharacterized protein YbjT (DUF2867 family)
MSVSSRQAEPGCVLRMTLGRVLVRQLHADGRAVRLLSRQSAAACPPGVDWATGDLRTGKGLADAVRDTAAIIYCASARTGDPAAAQRLLEAARAAGTPHLVYISIVGVDRIPLGYYRAKQRVEELIAGCGLPWTILRTTQFHDLILRGCQALGHAPVVPVPSRTAFQPIDVRDVAERLTALAAGPPAGRVPDMGGPQIRSIADLARTYLRARGRRRPVVQVRLPGAVAAGYRRGATCAPDHPDGQITFEQFLSEQIPAGQSGPTRAGR